jgi:polyisoprenoid-binding protein YceI
MTRVFLAALAASCLASPASATHWSVDYAKSRLAFEVQWSGEPFRAVFKSWKADIDFDPADLAHSRVSVTISLASETSDSPDNDDGIHGPAGFGVAQFPTATFEAASFSHEQGSSLYAANGRLTIRGVTRPVVLRFRLLTSPESARVTGGTEVMRTDFGLGTGEWAGETPVAHRVAITFDLQANKAH